MGFPVGLLASTLCHAIPVDNSLWVKEGWGGRAVSEATTKQEPRQRGEVRGSQGSERQTQK